LGEAVTCCGGGDDAQAHSGQGHDGQEGICQEFCVWVVIRQAGAVASAGKDHCGFAGCDGCTAIYC
jgi:hypothetical protein